MKEIIHEKVAHWVELFERENADPLFMLGVKPDGSPVICAVQTIEGKPFDMRQLLTDVLLRLRE